MYSIYDHARKVGNLHVISKFRQFDKSYALHMFNANDENNFITEYSKIWLSPTRSGGGPWQREASR